MGGEKRRDERRINYVDGRMKERRGNLKVRGGR